MKSCVFHPGFCRTSLELPRLSCWTGNATRPKPAQTICCTMLPGSAAEHGSRLLVGSAACGELPLVIRTSGNGSHGNLHNTKKGVR